MNAVDFFNNRFGNTNKITILDKNIYKVHVFVSKNEDPELIYTIISIT